MNRPGRALAYLLAALLLSGCFVTDARQTLRHLDDGTTLVAEGRRDVCLRIVDDASGETVAEDCDITENALEMDEYVLFDRPDGSLLVGVAPVDVEEVTVTLSSGERVEAELVESDLTTGFYLAELPPDPGTVEVVGRTADGDPVGEPLRIRGH